jgi:hypothetical protein
VARWFARCLGAGFDVPAGAGDLQLEIASLVPPTWLVIGHENGFLHKKDDLPARRLTETAGGKQTTLGSWA